MPRPSPTYPFNTTHLTSTLASLLWAVSCASATNAPSMVGSSTVTSESGGGESAHGFPGAGPAAVVPSDIAFVSLEGPLWVTKGAHLVFSDVVEANGPGAHIYSFDPATRRFSVVPYPAAAGAAATAGPTSTNGLGVDAAGHLLACERYNARVVRLHDTGDGSGGGGAGPTLTVVADRWPVAPTGSPLSAPNDIAVRRDGNMYFTDSDWGARPGTPHAAMGVYRVSPRGEVERVLDLQKPNGIALSPDGGTLYVGSDVQAKVWKLAVAADGSVGAATLLIDGPRVPGGFKVPDGICVDDGGNLYVTNNADEVKAVVVFDPAGRSLGRIPFPAAPSNCSFGGADRRTMYVTTLHALYEVRMPTPGLP